MDGVVTLGLCAPGRHEWDSNQVPGSHKDSDLGADGERATQR